MYAVDKAIKKAGVVAEKIMYEVKPIDSFGENVAGRLDQAEHKVSTEINKKKVQLLEKQVDDMLNLLSSQKPKTESKKAAIKSNKSNNQKIGLPKFAFKPIENRFLGCEFLIEITQNSQLDLVYHTISVIQQNISLSCRIHAHSSLNTAESKKALAKVKSDLNKRNVQVNTEISRATKDYNVNIAILVRKTLEETHCQLSIFSFASTKIQDEVSIAKFLWQMAGGKFTGIDNAWLGNSNCKSIFISQASLADVVLTC